MSETIQKIADAIFDAEARRTPCAPIRDLLPAGDVDGAYAAQEVNTRRRLASGRRLVGRKIGLTSVAVQKQLGVDQPDYGMLFDDMYVPDGWEIPEGRLIQPKAEAEVAFVMERDLDEERATIADVIRAVAFALPAIEVVDSRISDWQIGILDTIADNASSGLFVLGATPRTLDGLDLRAADMSMACRGAAVSVGKGLACLGHPLAAVWWLARTMARVGRPLKAGDIVMSGALGPMAVARPGDVMEAHISGLGSVRAAFGGGERA